jgi:hypothetical protein
MTNMPVTPLHSMHKRTTNALEACYWSCEGSLLRAQYLHDNLRLKHKEAGQYNTQACPHADGALCTTEDSSVDSTN